MGSATAAGRLAPLTTGTGALARFPPRPMASGARGPRLVPPARRGLNLEAGWRARAPLPIPNRRNRLSRRGRCPSGGDLPPCARSPPRPPKRRQSGWRAATIGRGSKPRSAPSRRRSPTAAGSSRRPSRSCSFRAKAGRSPACCSGSMGRARPRATRSPPASSQCCCPTGSTVSLTRLMTPISPRSASCSRSTPMTGSRPTWRRSPGSSRPPAPTGNGSSGSRRRSLSDAISSTRPPMCSGPRRSSGRPRSSPNSLAPASGLSAARRFSPPIFRSSTRSAARPPRSRGSSTFPGGGRTPRKSR